MKLHKYVFISHILLNNHSISDTDAKEMLELENQAKIQSAKSLNYTGKQRQLR